MNKPRPECQCPTCKRPYNVVRDGDTWRVVRHPQHSAYLIGRRSCDGGIVSTESVIAWTEARKNDVSAAVRGFVASMEAENADHERRVTAIREKLNADRVEEIAYERLLDKLRNGK
jgi:hypothetical protein